jgi:hypothetical protein
MEMLAQNAADIGLERLEAFGQAQVNIQEFVIHAAQARSKRPAIALEARLGKSGHGL